MKIGIVGTGRLGTALAHRLLGAGRDVRVWDRSRERASEAIGAGARWTPWLGTLATECDIVVTMLAGDIAVDRAYFGTDGLLTGHLDGRLFVDMSTVTERTHERLAAALADRGARLLECAVNGSAAAAKAGALVGFAGGDAGDLARARPLLDQLCSCVEHVGPMGAGARVKLAAGRLARERKHALSAAVGDEAEA